MEGLLFQTSLVAAFIAGMVALFAPCCITFLLPAYLGSVFREKEKVILMTLVFGLGIFVVLLPAVLGVAALSKFIFVYHDLIFFAGGVLLLVTAAMAFLGIKLPMPQISGPNIGNRTDVVSIFTLGVFSGITSACCAPVLVGLLTLTFLSPSFFTAFLMGVVYVLGMVVPLLIIALFLEGKTERLFWLRKTVGSFDLFGKVYQVTVSNLAASGIFFITGILTLYLTITGKLAADQMESFSQLVRRVAEDADGLIGQSTSYDFLLVAVLVALIVWALRRVV